MQNHKLIAIIACAVKQSDEIPNETGYWKFLAILITEDILKKPIATVDTSLGIDVEFVQDNHLSSKDAGTLRGLHFQAPPCSSQASKMLSSYF